MVHLEEGKALKTRLKKIKKPKKVNAKFIIKSLKK